MRRLLIACLILSVAMTAVAGENPNVGLYISFDQTGAGAWVPEYDPTPYEPFRAYVCVGDIDAGITTASFRLTDIEGEFPGAIESAEFVDLLDFAIGDWRTGIVVASMLCVSQPVVVLGYLEVVPLGPGFCIDILDHPDYPRWVTDCQDPPLVDFYRILGRGSVGDVLCPPGEGFHYVYCEPQGGSNPVHPPRYWYRVGVEDYCGIFRVQVFDSDPANYANWTVPYEGFEEEWSFGLEFDGENTWAVWESGGLPLFQGEYVLAFDNLNPATWGHWQSGTHHSEDYSALPDGYGYRVHVPVASSPVEETSWGMIKALFR